MAGCSNCGLVFTVDPPHDTGGRYGEEWFSQEYLPSFGVDPSNPSTEHLAPRFDDDISLIELYTKRGSILDVGAGAGLFLERAKARGWEVAGVEPATFGVSFAKRFLDIELFQGVLADAPFEEESFDAIVLQDVIEHVPSPRELLKKVYKLLKTGGVVMITTPNYQSISRALYRSNWALISPAEHLSLFRPKTLRKALNTSGLTVRLLKSTEELSVPRFHFDAQRWLEARRKTLTAASRIIPGKMREYLRIGDELVCIARRL